MKTITSKDNTLIKQSSLLKTSRGRKERDSFLVEGLRLCLDAVNSSYSFSDSFFTEQFTSAHPSETEKIISVSENPVLVTDDIMQKLCDTENPQGVVCVCKKPHLSAELDSLGKYVLLENLSDPSNLGAIARTTEAFGLNGLLIVGGCDPFNNKALRASMGALLRLPVIEFPSVEIALTALKQRGITTYAAVVSGEDKEIRQVRFDKGCAALIGNEANGLSETAKSMCDMKVTIDMDGRAESLNAHAASAVFIWEMVR